MKATREVLEERLKDRREYQHTLLEREQKVRRQLIEVAEEIGELNRQITILA